MHLCVAKRSKLLLRRRKGFGRFREPRYARELPFAKPLEEIAMDGNFWTETR
jgi:hypothetical protein